jgi:hypothetical protein
MRKRKECKIGAGRNFEERECQRSAKKEKNEETGELGAEINSLEPSGLVAQCAQPCSGTWQGQASLQGFASESTEATSGVR